MRPPSEMPAHVPEADLIFVLAGLEARKAYGLQLFRQRRALRILFSVGRFEIRRFSNLDIPVLIDLPEIAAPVAPPQRHFFVWFEGAEVHTERMLLGRFGTWSEIEALSRFLQKSVEIRSVLVVSSASHLPRVRNCCCALLPAEVKVLLLPSPEYEQETPHESWTQQAHHRKLVLIEWIKIPVYRILSWLPGLNMLGLER